MKIQSINPSTGELIKEFKPFSRQAVAEAVSKAKKAQKKWAELPKERRIRILSNLKKIIKRETKAIVDLIHQEAGMPREETEGVITDDTLIGFDNHIKDYRAIRTLDYSDDFYDSRIDFIPQGVIAHIGIWNYPFWQTMITAIPALLTGNAIVYKPSEYVTMTGLKIAEMIHEAGVPKNVYIPIIGGAEAGKAMVKSAADMIVFTGGIDTGQDIIKNAGVKPLLLELSGNDAAIVCADVNLDQAIPGILWGTFLHGGQVCIRIKRIFVVKKIAQQFIDALIQETEKLRIGKDIGPIIRNEARDYVHRQVQEAIKKGAKLLIGGKKVKGKGFFYEPTLLLYENSEIKMYEEEIFGPIAQIQIVNDEDEAIKLANDTIYGLGGTVWSKNMKKARRIADQLETGTIWINDSNVPIPGGIYCGGIKSSGIAGSYNRIQAFLKKKTIIANKGAKKRDWWFPYE